MADIGRREMLIGLGGLAASGLTCVLGGQEQTNFAPMNQSAYRPTVRPPKPNAQPLLTDLERDDLEHQLKCQCTCSLDVYTCRTTDFTCPVSPPMHQDVMRLVEGGYSADEILDAFVETYGEVALTAPKKEGFNWVGYFAPSVALATGAVVLTLLLRKWRGESVLAAELARADAAARPARPAAPVASADELEKLERALREDG